MRIIKPLLLFGQEYLRIYGRLAVNSFALRVDNKGEEENVGTGIVTNFIFFLNMLLSTFFSIVQSIIHF